MPGAHSSLTSYLDVDIKREFEAFKEYAAYEETEWRVVQAYELARKQVKVLSTKNQLYGHYASIPRKCLG